MFSALRTTIRPSGQLCAALSRQVRVSQPACAQSTSSTTPTNKDGAKRDLYSEGKQRYLTQYLSAAFTQEDPDKEFYHGPRGDIDFCSCDYLALAEHPELNRIEGEYIRDNGRITFNRSGAYPRDSNSIVKKFEDQASEWLGAADCIMTNSGTESNVSVLQLILCDNPLPIYIDKYAHATFVLGARASGRNDAKFFKHNSVDDLLRLIKENGRGVVCIDTVYSALGTITPIDEIVDICKQYDCILIADEAHALGIFGKQGEGLVKSKGLEKEVPFRTTSLGKAFGSGSGLVIFNEEMAEGKQIIPHLSSMAVFSLAPQECVAARHIRGLEMVKADQWRRDELSEKTEFFRKGAMKIGYNGYFVQNSLTNIIPFVVGKVDFAKDIYDMFIKRGIYPSPHFFPASPRDKSVLRCTICNFLSYKQLQEVLDFLEDIKPLVKPEQWPDNDPDIMNIGFQKV